MSAREEFLKQFRAEPNPYSNIKKIFAIVSGKGGVGKSLVTALSAITMQKKGYKCAILDADVTGPSIPNIFHLQKPLYGTEEGILPKETASGIKVISANFMVEDPSQAIIWRSPMITSVIKQFYSEVYWGDIDYMFIDLPPGTGDVPLTVFQSLPVDGIIIVTTPQDLVSMIVEKSIDMAEKMEIPIVGVVENMSYIKCPDCGKKISLFHNNDVLIKKYSKIAEIPLDPELSSACDKGTLEAYQNDYLDPLADLI